MSSDCIHCTSKDDLCSVTPAVLTIELIAFNQSSFELIMETQNVTSLVIKYIFSDAAVVWNCDFSQSSWTSCFFTHY